MKQQPTLLVLAAGMATRYGSLKQLDHFGPNGETIIDYSIYDAIRSGFGKVVFVIRESIKDDFRREMDSKFSGRIEIDYVLQELDMLPEGFVVPDGRHKPWGTGHAMWVAAEKINEPFAVINADDFYGHHSYQLLADFLKNESTEHVLIGYQLNKTLSPNGAVSRGLCEISSGGALKAISELTHIIQTPVGIMYEDENNKQHPLLGDETVSMNMMGFRPEIFKYFENLFIQFLKTKSPGNLKAEFYLPEVVNHLVKNGTEHIKVLTSSEKWFGVTFPEDKPAAIENINRLIQQGQYPQNLWGK